nr:MAG TPA: hypothetical protein [Caudoviricetes sp.]
MTIRTYSDREKLFNRCIEIHTFMLRCCASL